MHTFSILTIALCLALANAVSSGDFNDSFLQTETEDNMEEGNETELGQTTAPSNIAQTTEMPSTSTKAKATHLLSRMNVTEFETFLGHTTMSSYQEQRALRMIGLAIQFLSRTGKKSPIDVINDIIYIQSWIIEHDIAVGIDSKQSASENGNGVYQAILHYLSMAGERMENLLIRLGPLIEKAKGKKCPELPMDAMQVLLHGDMRIRKERSLETETSSGDAETDNEPAQTAEPAFEEN